MFKFFALLIIINLFYYKLYSNEFGNIDSDTLKNNLLSKNFEQIPNDFLILEYNFIPNIITANYEKNILDISKNHKLYFQAGLGFSIAFVVPDGIAIPINLKYVLGKYNSLEIGTGILLNGYFFKNNKSLGFLSSDLVKLNADISYRYNVKYINGNEEDTDLFKITFGFVYMFNSPGTKDQYGGSPFIHFVPRLGLSFNLWTL